ncbi:MAG: hypothetical protein WDW36_005714 [Sanguina aurantia]
MARGKASGTPSRQAIISRPRLACRTTSLPHSEHAGLAGVVSEPPRSVQNLTVQNYHTFVESNDSLVIVDYYTDWCGPCKMIAPELERMAAQYSKVAFAKLNCGLDNDSKRLAIALGIKALPTFHIFKGGKKQAELTGAKAAQLRQLIESHM